MPQKIFGLIVLTTFLLIFWTPSSLARSSRVRNRKSVVTVFTTLTRLGDVPMEEILKALGDRVDQTVIPDNIYHGGIIAFSKAYEYIVGRGIVITNARDYIKDNIPMWTDSTFLTETTEVEFENWINVQKLKHFTSTNYNLADNNCLTFVAKACEFLGGAEPPKLARQRQFALNNREGANKLQEVGQLLFV